MSDTVQDEVELIAEAARRTYAINQQIKELTEERDSLAAFFKNYDGFAQTGDYNFGDYTVKVGANRRVDNTLAKAVLSEQDYQLITKPAVDSTLAKKYLSGESYDSIQKVFPHRITVTYNG